MSTVASLLALLLPALAPTTGAEPADLEKARAEALRAAVAEAAPFIVSIELVGGAQPVQGAGPDRRFEEPFRVGEGPTTGIILASDGYIVTSTFNFTRDPAVITIALADGRRFVAKLLGRDLIRRLALLKIEANDLPVAKWTPRNELAVGQYAIACGRGLGGEQPSLALGIISALERRNGNAVQTDAKTSPVNYGGPLLDLEGRVVGVIVPMAGSGGALAGAEWYDSGIGFAIYKDRLDLVRGRLVAGETLEPGKIGVVLEPEAPSALPFLDKLLPASGGVGIRAVAGKSPAARAKLQPGDRILALDGQCVADVLELQRRLSDRAAGERVRLTIKRRWETLAVELTLARPGEIEDVPEPAPPSAPVPHEDQEGPPRPEESPTSRPSAD